MKIESPRFGTLDIEPTKIIEFPQGLPGFEDCRRFSLFHPEGEEPKFFILQSVDDAAIAFHVTDPALLGFSYEIDLSDEEMAAIGLADQGEAAVVVMLSKREGDPNQGSLHANLKAPLVINTRTQRGLQHFFTQLRATTWQGSGYGEQAMTRQIISTAAAPAAIGTYSQAVRAGATIYLSGQIGLDPASMTLVEGIDAQIARVFENLKAVAAAAGATLDDAVKFTIYLTDLGNFSKVNEAMARYLKKPYPARAAVGVKELPRGALVEADAVLVIGER